LGCAVLVYIAAGLGALGVLAACFETVHDYFGVIGVIACFLTGIVTAIPVALILLVVHADWAMFERLIGVMVLIYLMQLAAAAAFEWKGRK